jgi:hypothetical protein
MLVSCVSFSDNSFQPVTASIRDQLPGVTLTREFAVAMGGLVFDVLDVVAIGEDGFSEMDAVQVAVYKVTGVENFDSLNFEQTLSARDRHLHWDTVVRVREESEKVWVLLGMDYGKASVEAVSIFVLDNDELVLINVTGEFNELLEYALEPAHGYTGIADFSG